MNHQSNRQWPNSLVRFATYQNTGQANPSWGYQQLCGRLVEISGIGAVASITAAVGLIADAQKQGELVAWIGMGAGIFFPPDVVSNGVDIEALAVIRSPNASGSARIANYLIRSRAFGLVVIDFTSDAKISMALQGRLATLAQKSGTAVVGITKTASMYPSIGSMVSLRIEILRQRVEFDRFHCQVNVLKDKRCGPGWKHMEVMCGPVGLH